MFMQVVSHSPPTHANTSYTKSNINNVHFTPEYLMMIIDQVAYVILSPLSMLDMFVDVSSKAAGQTTGACVEPVSNLCRVSYVFLVSLC